MSWTDQNLRWFGGNVQRLIEGRDLNRVESYEMFRQVLEETQPELQQGAFLTALSAKGETPQEIAGAWQAIYQLDTTRVTGAIEGPLVENSGTGMDPLKTFNVSSAAAVVAAAGGARMARHGARALTSKCGTVDLLEAVGVDVEADVEVAEASIREAGIGLFNGMSPKVHPKALARIVSRIRFGSTLNIAASLASPCRPTHALRGVYAPRMIPRVAEVMREIGYQRAMVVHGLDGAGRQGMDELSTLGESQVREFSSSAAEETYTIAPEDVGLRRAAYDEIQARSNAQNEAVRFLGVIRGRGHPACQDITCFNAGAILYLIDRAKDIRAGVASCREIIESGAALRKMAQWVAAQADEAGQGIRQFLRVAEAAGLKAEAEAAL